MAKIDVAEEIRWRTLTVQVCLKHGNDVAIRRMVCDRLDISMQTLRKWIRRVQNGEPVYRAPGRRQDDVPREQRQGVIRALLELGPYGGVPALRGRFPSVPYRFLARMKQRFLAVLKRRYRWYQRRLRWLRAGAVWAADFTKARAGLDQGKRLLLLVRDLASGCTLAAVPCRTENARATGTVLLSLFLLMGAPLAIKFDNGSAFIAGATRSLLAEHGVVPLYSPPRTPQYNGSCERAGGCLKKRMAHVALVRGHPGHWTRLDIQEAMRIANTTARPHGATGPTPAECLKQRKSVTAAERRAFARTLRAETALRLLQFRKENARMTTCSERDAIDRKAMQHALCEHGYLRSGRGRLSTLVSTWKRLADA